MNAKSSQVQYQLLMCEIDCWVLTNYSHSRTTIIQVWKSLMWRLESKLKVPMTKIFKLSLTTVSFGLLMCFYLFGTFYFVNLCLNSPFCSPGKQIYRTKIFLTMTGSHLLWLMSYQLTITMDRIISKQLTFTFPYWYIALNMLILINIWRWLSYIYKNKSSTTRFCFQWYLLNN